MPFEITRSLATHQAEKLAEIEALRLVKNNQPILYGGMTIDADTVARENINGKIVEISAKIDLGITTAEMFWKDSTNTIHSWPTLAEYLVFLKGLAIAIAERNTLLYGISWTKKAAVLALTSLFDVTSYDVDKGWI